MFRKVICRVLHFVKTLQSANVYSGQTSQRSCMITMQDKIFFKVNHVVQLVANVKRGNILISCVYEVSHCNR